jgi:hypothetical protein
MIIVTHMNIFHAGETSLPFVGFRNTNETATERIYEVKTVTGKYVLHPRDQ